MGTNQCDKHSRSPSGDIMFVFESAVSCQHTIIPSSSDVGAKNVTHLCYIHPSHRSHFICYWKGNYSTCNAWGFIFWLLLDFHCGISFPLHPFHSGYFSPHVSLSFYYHCCIHSIISTFHFLPLLLMDFISIPFFCLHSLAFQCHPVWFLHSVHIGIQWNHLQTF